MWACVYIYIYTYMDVFIYLYRYFFYSLFLIKGLLHYGIVLMSAIHQQESAIVIHMSPASWTSLPPVTPFYLSRLSQSTSLNSLRHTVNSVYVSILLSLFIPPYPTPNIVHKSVLYICISSAALWMWSSVPSFSSPYVCVNILCIFLFLTCFALYKRL